MPSTTEHAGTLSEQTEHLAERLDRITAAATTLRVLISAFRHDVPRGRSCPCSTSWTATSCSQPPRSRTSASAPRASWPRFADDGGRPRRSPTRSAVAASAARPARTERRDGMHTRVEVVDEHLGRAFGAGACDRGLGGFPGIVVLRDGLHAIVSPHDPASSRTRLDMQERAWLTCGHRLILPGAQHARIRPDYGFSDRRQRHEAH